MSSRARSASSPDEVPQAGRRAARTRARASRRPPRPGPRGSAGAASWIGSARSARVLASASSRIARRPGSTSSSSPGPSRPRRIVSFAANGTAPGLGRNGDQSIARYRERRRSKAVAVDHRADPDAVREDDRGGAVPRGEESGGPAPQRRDVRMRRASQGQRLGDRGQEGGGQVPAGGHQQFERLVERERVRPARREQRPGRQQLGRDRLRAAIAGAAADLLAIAADRVDLAVVGDEPERLGEAPHRDACSSRSAGGRRCTRPTTAPAGPGRAAAAGRP